MLALVGWCVCEDSEAAIFQGLAGTTYLVLWLRLPQTSNGINRESPEGRIIYVGTQ